MPTAPSRPLLASSSKPARHLAGSLFTTLAITLAAACDSGSAACEPCPECPAPNCDDAAKADANAGAPAKAPGAGAAKAPEPNAAVAADPGADTGADPAQDEARDAEASIADAPPQPAPAARYRPPVLDAAPAAASISPGEYRCKISREYKLRPCTVARDDSGHTRLTIPEGLIALEGVLYDEGKGVHLDAWPTEARPFGCYSCAERCTEDPGSCACTELPTAASEHCLAQPISAELKKSGKGWKGELRWNLYFNRYAGQVPERRPVGYEAEANRFVIEIRP